MKKILILKLGAIGDVVHSLPLLSTLRSCLPESYIGWAVEEQAAPVLEGNPDLTELILLERKRLSGISGLPYLRSWVRKIRARSFDLVLDLHNLMKTGMIALATGASVRIGFRKIREGNFLFMNRWVRPGPQYRHAVDKYLSLLSPLGIVESQWNRSFPLKWNSVEEEAVEAFLKNQRLSVGGPLVAINPGANWASKRWMPDRFAALADYLVKVEGARIIILWGPQEKDLAESVAGAMSEEAVLAPETTLKQVMALIRRSSLLISGDSGPVHLAAALGIRTVVLFGPSDPIRNGPYGSVHEVVQSPVPPATHWQAKERGDQWMREITVEEVVRAASKQLRMIKG